jgi:hypothetical protein
MRGLLCTIAKSFKSLRMQFIQQRKLHTFGIYVDCLRLLKAIFWLCFDAIMLNFYVFHSIQKGKCFTRVEGFQVMSTPERT